MTTLQQYLAETRQTQKQFAERVGLNQATVSKICAGRTGVSLQTALRIQEVTDGKVSVHSLSRVNSAPSVGAENAR